MNYNMSSRRLCYSISPPSSAVTSQKMSQVHLTASEPAVLVMEDGATATLYSAHDGSTVLEGPDGETTTVLPSSPPREDASPAELEEVNSYRKRQQQSLLVCGEPVLQVRSESASAFPHQRNDEVLGGCAKSVATIVVSNSLMNFHAYGGCSNARKSLPVSLGRGKVIGALHSGGLSRGVLPSAGVGFSVVSSSSEKSAFEEDQKNFVDVLGTCANSSGSNNSAGINNKTRTYGNKNYLKRQQVLRRQSSHEQPSLLNSAISKNVISAAKSSAFSYVLGASSSKPDAGEPDSVTEIGTLEGEHSNLITVTDGRKSTSSDFTILPKIAVAVMSTDGTMQKQGINALVLASTENGKSSSSSCNFSISESKQQIFSSCCLSQSPSFLVTLPNATFTGFTSSSHSSDDKKNGVAFSKSAADTQVGHTEVSDFSTANKTMREESSEESDAATAGDEESNPVPPEEATVTTAVYEFGAGPAIVDSSAGTATLVKGAEVVRSSAVSFATPIMHQVFLQATATINGSVVTSDGPSAEDGTIKTETYEEYFQNHQVSSYSFVCPDFPSNMCV